MSSEGGMLNRLFTRESSSSIESSIDPIYPLCLCPIRILVCQDTGDKKKGVLFDSDFQPITPTPTSTHDTSFRVKTNNTPTHSTMMMQYPTITKSRNSSHHSTASNSSTLNLFNSRPNTVIYHLTQSN